MVREQRFKAKLSGFDKNEVITFLMDIAEDMEELIEENRLLKGEIENVQRKQKDLEDLLLSVKQFSEEKMKRTEIEAQHIISDAERKASEIQQSANQKLSEAENKSREMLTLTDQKVREILNDAEKAKARLEREVADLKEKRNTFLSQLQAVLQSHQVWIREQEHVG
jgi:cell division septum initiation protein DivIVA